jgi:hypothetical protein
MSVKGLHGRPNRGAIFKHWPYMCYNSFHLETLYLTVKLLGKLQVNCIILLFYNMLALISETFKGSLWGYLITVTLLPAI